MVEVSRYAFCGKIKECGHECQGVLGETECFHCPFPECVQNRLNTVVSIQPQDLLDMQEQGVQLQRRGTELLDAAATDVCKICWVAGLQQKPCIALKCCHVFHADCLHNRLEGKGNTRRLSVEYITCPLCKQSIEFKETQAPAGLRQLLESAKLDISRVEQAAEVICCEEGLNQAGSRVMTPGDAYFGKPAKFMLEQATLYNCHSCSKIYFGGMNDYEGALREHMDQQSFLCLKCAERELGYGQEMCELHGNEFTDFKCQMCCSIALYVYEGGQKLRCQPCFNDMMENNDAAKTDCTGGPNCPLGISQHPAAPQRYALGCAICRSEKLELIVKESNSAGVNVEKREDLMQKHGEINNIEQRDGYIQKGQL